MREKSNWITQRRIAGLSVPEKVLSKSITQTEFNKIISELGGSGLRKKSKKNVSFNITMNPNKIKNLKNKFYIKYYMVRAGNDNPKLKKEMFEILKKLEALLD